MSNKIFSFSILFLLTLSVSSCISGPSSQRAAILDSESDASSDGDVTGTPVTDVTTNPLPQTLNFFQIGAQESLNNLNVFADYNESFLMRGNNLISFLSQAVLTTQVEYCVSATFPGIGNESVTNTVLFAARVRSFFSPTLNTQEYFLQVEPNNGQANLLPCNDANLRSTIENTSGTTGIAFSLSSLCPNCSRSISSGSLSIYDQAGNSISGIELSHLSLNVIPPEGSTIDQPTTCSNNNNCTSQGFNCCLSGQCVNHGERRPEVSTASNRYLQALRITQERPELIRNYTDVFFVCEELVPAEPEPNDEIDPVQVAQDKFRKNKDLFRCLTPIIDEISVCRKDFENATDSMSSAPFQFDSEVDDLTFKSFNPLITTQNISEISYGGVIFYKEALTTDEQSVALDPNFGVFGAANDNISERESISLQIPRPTNATTDQLQLYFKIDGTCERLGSSLARCSKFYTQGQVSTPARSSDHTSGNQSFLIPSYADTSFSTIVEVGGSSVSEGSDTWSIVGKSIRFNPIEFPISNNQEVKITYFVTANVESLTGARFRAQSAVNQACECDSLSDNCSLSPVETEINGVSTITSYACIRPNNTVTGPLEETVFLSSKTVPHKFYDELGTSFDSTEVTSDFIQEGAPFEYLEGNDLKPNNIEQNIGFNEIYGSMNINTNSPKPARVVNIESGKTYSLFVSQGTFSTCLGCGTDYYSNIQQIFPSNFQHQGAGYFPDFVESRRVQNQSPHPSDDSKFGRACFVPATMLPWTHAERSSVTDQRRSRQDAQHFLFANGLNKDWYGFDYASVIGSFDGVTWFSVGNQREIRATSNKLYLALNAYFGDLTIENSYTVHINEESELLGSGSNIRHDLDSDGAFCQRAHLCETDNDCITQLGYEYTCANVTELQTPWPEFDNNGDEIAGSTSKFLASLVGGTNSQNNRCVYRGRGAICEQASSSVSETSSYTKSDSTELHHCGSNTTCSLLTSAQFNTKISRFAQSPRAQNIQDFITDKTDEFGLGARLLGRPYNYLGNSQTPSTIRSQLQSNNVRGLCTPGQSPEVVTTLEQSNRIRTLNADADSISNVGVTYNSSVPQHENYLALCPATDDSGNYTKFLNVDLNDPAHSIFAINQNISSNSLLQDSFSNLTLFNDNETLVTRIGIKKNSCLRAPGASCFSDFECAPSDFIAGQISSLNTTNVSISSAELAFWKENLTCAGPVDRYIAGFKNPEYDLSQNRCCRETGSDFTYQTQKHEGSDIQVISDLGVPLIPGVNQDINDPKRYSRTHTVYDKLISEPERYPSLVSAASQPGIALILSGQTIKQYNTLHLNNSRMCCTGNWIRTFATGTFGNGGGHNFSASKLQTISINTFKPLAWNANNVPAINTFPAGIPYDPTLQTYTCTPEDHLTADCEIKNITAGSFEERRHLEWFGKLELLGIPQVLIETNNTIFKPLATEPMDFDNDGNDDAQPQDDISARRLPLDNTIKDVNVDGRVDATYNGESYYSAASSENYNLGGNNLKKIFSEDSFSCCLPTGVDLPAATTDQQCCTGRVTDAGEARRCCMDDFTDISVYTNRYVSSEGVTNERGTVIDDSSIDPTSGYLDQDIVMNKASQLCCSGRATTGRALDEYFIPINVNQTFNDQRTRRWMYDDTLDRGPSATIGFDRVDLFNRGVRWNNHVYCIPEELADLIDASAQVNP